MENDNNKGEGQPKDKGGNGESHVYVQVWHHPRHYRQDSVKLSTQVQHFGLFWALFSELILVTLVKGWEN